MYNSRTLTYPFTGTKIADGKKLLPTRLSFEVKLTDITDYYEIKVKMCANRSKMVQGLDYLISYTPTVDVDPCRIILNIAASDGMTMLFIAASNAF